MSLYHGGVFIKSPDQGKRPLIMEAPQVKRGSLHNAHRTTTPSLSHRTEIGQTPLGGCAAAGGGAKGAPAPVFRRRALSHSGTALSFDTADRVTISLGTPPVLVGRSRWNRIV